MNAKGEMSYFKTINLSIEVWHYWSALVGMATAFLFNVQPFLTLLIFLVIADLITGVLAARHKKENISSKGIFRTVEKLLVECIAILCAEGVRVTLFPDINLTYVVVFVITTAEFKSVIENTEVILDLKIWRFIKEKIKLIK